MKAFPLSALPAHLQSQVVPQLHGFVSLPPVKGENVTFTGYSNWTLPYPPSANAYWRSITINGRGRVVVSKEAKTFKKAVSLALAGISPVGGPVCLTATFYRPRKRGDLDNGLKCLCDALKGIAYHDDEQITEIRASRKEDKLNPRVEISVTQIQ
jgi:crossover junction endodeoxyribonuclease RusA